MKLSLFHGINYNEEKQTRGITEKPVEFRRTSFDSNEVVFDLNNTFKLNRTAEDAWSTNRSIKNISEIKLGLDSIGSLVNEERYINYSSSEGIYPFFSKNRRFKPEADILNQKVADDSIKAFKKRREKALTDSLEKLKELAKIDTAANLIENPETRILSSENITEISNDNPRVIANTISSRDSLFQTPQNKSQGELKSVTNRNSIPDKLVKETRTAPLTDKEKEKIDSLV